MPNKKVGFKPKPQNNQSGNVEKWVSDRELSEQTSHTVERNKPTEAKSKMKRLTIDVSEELHRAIKMRAVEQGVPMADMLRSLLENNYL